MGINKLKQGSIGQSAVTSDNIVDGTIVNADISPSAAIANAKVPGIATLCTTATSINATVGAVSQNIGLLGFKMAVNDGLTVFNLVDGVVDEFHDESGTDEAEGSNDTYCASSDFYTNTQCTPTPFSAGFSPTAITEPDTSTAGTNPTVGSGTFGAFTVPTGTTSVDIKVWGAAGGSTYLGDGGGGGYAEGTLAVTGGQSLAVVAGEGGSRGTCGVADSPPAFRTHGGLGGGGPGSAGGAGLAGVFVAPATTEPALSTAPQAYVVAGGGGAGGYKYPPFAEALPGGAGGGLTGDAGGTQTEQVNTSPGGGGGGDQEQGGAAAPSGSGAAYEGLPGSLFTGGSGAPGPSGDATYTPGGGSGYYGGGSGPLQPSQPQGSSAGGGSSFYGHPQITSGSTEEGAGTEGGGTAIPQYQPGTNDAHVNESGNSYPDMPVPHGEDGYVFISGSKFTPSTASTTIVSNAFTANSVPTTSRIVVFEENVDTPTLNTDIIASISRDGGSNFTTATLTDSGYVTGSSGQRILTGTATVSGQPSGQSMRWKLALANNQVKIHGVALQWS